MSQPSFQINERVIGNGAPVFIIAELSANHGQDFDRAVSIVRAAADAGADAIKLQTYTADTLTLDSNERPFQINAGSVWDGTNLHQLYQQAYTPWDWHPRLKSVAEDLGLEFFSSPFDATAVDFLESLEVPVHKIASFEIVDIPLLKYVAQTGKPVIMSTGMATLEEIDRAVTTLRENGTSEIALLKCTSAYPAAPESMNLRTIPELSKRFGVPAGLSDHTTGIEAPVLSVAMGGAIIEKHLTLSRSDGGPDAGFSLEPAEFTEMVSSVRTAEAALGRVHFGPTDFDKRNRCFRRSLFVVEDIQPGHPFTVDNVRSIRPADGLPPRYLDDVIGRTATESISKGTPLAWKHVAKRAS